MEYRKPNYAGFVAIASGPLGGNLTSLKQALEMLLDGACYNVKEIEPGSIIDEVHWKKAFQKKLADKEWVNFLEGRGYRSGVGYPISLFYRDILRIFPRVKLIILPPETVTWNGSIRFGTPFNIHKADRTKHQPNKSNSRNLQLINSNGVEIQSHISFGLLNKASAIPMKIEDDVSTEFYRKWFEEVMRSVPEDRLLIIDIKDEWEHLCNFLDVPIPKVPFPMVDDNHNNSNTKSSWNYYKCNWTVTYIIPITLLIYIGYAVKKRQYIGRAINVTTTCNKCILYSVRNIIESIIEVTFDHILNFSIYFGVT